MKIILNEVVNNLGDPGDIVNVKDGYARNYLIPKGWAQKATKNNIEAIKKLIESKEKKDAKTRENLGALGKQLDKVSIKLELKAGEEGKLFGSVTSQMIVDAISEKGFNINKKEVELSETINQVGKYFVNINLGQGYSGKVKVKVNAEE